LLVVDNVPAQDSWPESVVFVFDGGVLDGSELMGTDFPDREIRSAAFFTLADARLKVKSLLADRLVVALEPAQQGSAVLCEQARRVA
jgi:hypothetical protein